MHKQILSALRANASARVLAVAFGVPFALAAHGAQAGALPGHGHYVSGQGSINKANRSLTVKQSSTTGIINWKSFSTGKHDAVTFDNGGGATLNRVTGGNLSTIAGSLHATGSLYLMNGAGVIISGTGRVVTGGNFVATSGTVSNTAFDDGRREFLHTATAVINRGHITAGGNAKLVGHTVTDSGTIRGSHVWLNGREGLTISGSITAQRASGAGGNVLAMGHTIVIGKHGEIDASAASAHLKGGTIDILAERTATVAGMLKAKGGEHGAGGFIDTSGKHVHIADSARISTLAKHGAAGTWLIDPQDFTVAASGGDITGATLSTELGGGNVDIQSSTGATAGSGDINIDDAVTWSSGHALTLDAYRNININAAVSITGAGGVSLIYGDQAQNGTGNIADGDMSFDLTSAGFGGHIDFGTTDNGATLSINGTSYTLLYSLSDLAGINSALQNNYALATNVDDANAAWTPLGTNGAGGINNAGNGFSGSFTGLGHTVANLNINVGPDTFLGLFGYASGPISDVGVAGGSIQAVGPSEYIGGLVGRTNSTVNDAFATDSIAVSITNPTMPASSGFVGGLVGYAGGEISNSFATGGVNALGQSGEVGGLAGNALGGISDSYATGVIFGNFDVGGLAGATTGAVSSSYATGAVNGLAVYEGAGSPQSSQLIGGLIGTAGGTVSNSYATGLVSGDDGVGGLIGSASFAVSNSFATGTVSGSVGVGGLVGETTGSISDSYATGAVIVSGASSGQGGGLVGLAQAAVTDSYATGAVYGVSGSDKVGGLIGEADSTVTNVYATGAVSTGSGATHVGGLVGYNGGATFTDAYWDTQTTGQSSSAGGTALTTAQMQSGSAVFSGNNWGGGTNGLYPYLTNFFPNGVQAISGIAYDGAGETLAPGPNDGGIVVSLDANGGYLAQGNVGANGYYYIVVPAGTIANGSSLVSYIPTNVHLGTVNAAAWAASSYGAGTPAQTGVDLHEGYLSDTTSATELSALPAFAQIQTGADAAVGSDSAATAILAAVPQEAAYWITGASFTFDQAYTGNGFLLETRANAPITVSHAVTIDDGGSLTLLSGGALNIGAAVSAGNSATMALSGSTINFNGGHLSFSGTGNSVDLEGVLGFYNGGRVFFDSTSNALKVNDNTYTLVDSVSALATAANATPNGYFALADNYDASNDAIWTASPVTAQFLGAFEGLGNTINGLRINDTSGSDNVGLFSDLEGAVSNLTLTNVQITGGDSANVGALAGIAGAAGDPGGIANVHVTGIVQGGANSSVGGIVGNAGFSGGVITDASMSGSVLGGDDSTVGGIAGVTKSIGTISQSYSTASVSGGQSSIVGGLVGDNEGHISDSYAAGIVSALDGSIGDESEVGGLVGHNGGTISDSYSLTYVENQSGHSNTDFGGLVGSDGDSGSVSDSFWDTQTSGIASASQGAGDTANTAGITGITSAALQSGLPGSFSASDWSVVADSTFPYLSWQFAAGDTPEVISGTTGLNNTGLSLAALSAGVSIGQMYSFADGSFYLLVAPGTVADTGVAVYDTAFHGNLAFSDSSTTGLVLPGDGLNIATADTSLATLGANVGATLGTTFSNGGPAPTTLSDVMTEVNNELYITASGAFNVDQSLTNQDITITTGGNLTISQEISAGEATMLYATGTITETGAGVITGGGELEGSSHGAVTLGGANQIAYLDSFTTGGNNAFSLTDDAGLTTIGTIDTGTAALALTIVGSGDGIAVDGALDGGTVDLVSAAGISEKNYGSIHAVTLKGSSHGTTALTSASNVITDLGTFSTGGHAFSLKDDHSLTTTGTVNAGTAKLALTTTGAGHGISVRSTLDGGTVDLTSAGSISENNSGAIHAATLTGTSKGIVALTGSKNVITDLGNFSTGGKSFSLKDDHDLTTKGAVNARSAGLTLTTTGKNHDIFVESKLEGGTVDLASAATVGESGSGDIDAKTLKGSAHGTVKLASNKNTIADLNKFSTGGGNFSLSDDHALTTTGTVNTGKGALSLKTVGKNHNLTIASTIAGGTLDLATTGKVTETSKASIVASKLNVIADTGITLTSKHNKIKKLGKDKTKKGPNKVRL